MVQFATLGGPVLVSETASKGYTSNMKVQSTFEKRLATYGTMSMALAAVAAPQAADASIISYLGPSVTDSSSSPIYFNALTGSIDTSPATGDYELILANGDLARLVVFKGSLLNSSSFRKFAVSALDFPDSQQASSAARLPFGASVGPGRVFNSFLGTLAEQSLHLSFNSNFSGHFGHFNSTSGDVSGYLGLEVVRGLTREYGWANIVVHPNFSVTLNSFTLDTSGSSLNAGTEAPEPASILLLALGAAGIAAYRRKRKA
jgi:hypothetical protein